MEPQQIQTITKIKKFIKKLPTQSPVYFNRKQKKAFKEKCSFRNLVNQIPNQEIRSPKQQISTIEYASSSESEKQQINTKSHNNWDLKNRKIRIDDIYNESMQSFVETKLESLKQQILNQKEDLQQLNTDNNKIEEEIELLKRESENIEQQLNKFDQFEKINKKLTDQNEKLFSKFHKLQVLKHRQYQEIFEYNIHQNINPGSDLEIKVIPENDRPTQGSLLSGDYIQKVLEHSFYDTVKNVDWKKRQFKVSWKKRSNGVEPCATWVKGEFINIADQMCLYNYYKQMSTFNK